MEFKLNVNNTETLLSTLLRERNTSVFVFCLKNMYMNAETVDFSQE